MAALYIILGIIALIIILFSIKVSVTAEYADSFSLDVQWLFIKLHIFPQTEEQKAKREAKKAKKEEKKKKKKKPEEEKKEAAAANKAAQTYKTVSLGDISFTWPCPASGRITSGFGGRKSPTKGASSNHQGIDISASTGTSIVAAAAGEVVIATYSSSAGNYVMISHGGGVYTVYMHASSLLVSQGQSVKKGQTIASHLHFGVRVNGSYVNPTKYVSP